MKFTKLVCSALFIAAALGANQASAQTGQGYFKLQTMFQAPDNKCFEGNRFAPDAVLQGGAFMDDCQNVSGQAWKAVPEGNGYFRLKTEFQGENKCLEGNRFAPDAVLQGAAFMDNCQDVSGQLWKAVPEGNGYFRLKTRFQGENKCLEGNRFAPDAVLRGAAFMDDCQNVSGQLWALVGGDLVSGVPQGNGQIVVQQPVGQVIVQQPADQIVVQQPVGQIVVQQPVDQVVVQQPVGQNVLNLPAGQYIIQLPAGQYVVQQPGGQLSIPQSVVVASQPAGECRFYEHINYEGAEWILQANHRVHWYDEAQQRVNFRSSGRSSFVGQEYYDNNSGGNDIVSSAKVTPNCKAVLWEHPFENGRMLEVTSDTPNFVDLNFNDIASSAECICQN